MNHINLAVVRSTVIWNETDPGADRLNNSAVLTSEAPGRPPSAGSAAWTQPYTSSAPSPRGACTPRTASKAGSSGLASSKAAQKTPSEKVG